jgi:hypothetical protein
MKKYKPVNPKQGMKYKQVRAKQSIIVHLPTYIDKRGTNQAL